MVRLSALLLLGLPLLGCGRGEFASVGDKHVAPEEAPASASIFLDSGRGEQEMLESVNFTAGAAADLDPDATKQPRPADRKIIYRAEVDLVVEEFIACQDSLPRLASKHGGYLADMQASSNSGRRQLGRWVARVPVDRFDSFLDEVYELGVPERKQLSTDDVSEEFVDLEARISAKKKLEERVIKLLEEPYGEIKDLLEVERELARVRSEIERMEGRRRYLINQTSMTTVTIKAREEKHYTPPQAPGFGNRIAGAWHGSLGSLGRSGQALVVGGATAAPWLLLISAVLLPAWVLGKKRGK